MHGFQFHVLQNRRRMESQSADSSCYRCVLGTDTSGVGELPVLPLIGSISDSQISPRVDYLDFLTFDFS